MRSFRLLPPRERCILAGLGRSHTRGWLAAWSTRITPWDARRSEYHDVRHHIKCEDATGGSDEVALVMLRRAHTLLFAVWVYLCLPSFG